MFVAGRGYGIGNNEESFMSVTENNACRRFLSAVLVSMMGLLVLGPLVVTSTRYVSLRSVRSSNERVSL